MRTVLFVDDEQSIRNAIERLYLERDDVRCLFAASGQEGLDILRREEVWVVMSDYMMPGMRGVEFLSRVKGVSPDTLRIMMTAFADLSIAVDAINFMPIAEAARNNRASGLIVQDTEAR